MYTYILSIMVICLMLVSCSKDPLSSGPDGADLKKRFSTELPAYVGVDSFDVQASENIGSKVEPKFVSRFKATIKLNADTFLESGREGTVVFVAPHLKSGEKREVYGKAVSGYHGGSWQTAFQLDSNPVPGLGTPRDAFGATRVIVKNSEEETLYREQQKREREASAKTNSAILGNWTGTVHQGYQTYQTTMIITNSMVGQSVGTIDYPSLKCGGRLVLRKAESPHFVMEEILEYGHGKCVNKGTIKVDVQGNGMTWQYFRPNGSLTCNAVLNRVD